MDYGYNQCLESLSSIGVAAAREFAFWGVAFIPQAIRLKSG